VKCRRESRSLIYTAEYAAMNGLLAYLTENCCQGDAAAFTVPACNPRTTTKGRSIIRKGTRHEAPARARFR
jgi:ArsR family transcriptional regulator, arsenate/arsenite/antimonite-responsive transcriptional repressor